MRRWSVTGPAVVVDDRFVSDTPPTVVVMMLTGDPEDPRTADAVPPHVYVKAGLLPASVHAVEQFRMYICNPSVVLVSRTDEPDAVVVRFTVFMGSVLVLIRSTTRLMVSPGTTLVALTLKRLAAPLAPRAISTLPAVTLCEADVVEVKVAKVPRPAMAPAVRELLVGILRDDDYEVRTVADGSQALSVASEFRPHLVLLDAGLPGVDGWGVARRLRQAGDVPIVFVTGSDSRADIRAGFDVGGDDYIVKPFDAEELSSRVRAILRRAGHAVRQAWEIEGLVVDSGARTVTRYGMPIS